MEKTILENAISNIHKEFKESYFNFLYEADIRAKLFSNLYDSFTKSIEISPDLDLNEFGLSSNGLISNPVKCEYPSSEKFDIAVIDEIEIKDNPKIYNDLWNLKLKIAIEIKYCLLGYKPFYYFYTFQNDLNKLKNYKKNYCITNFTGISLLFIQQKISDSDPLLEEIEQTELKIKDNISGFIFLNEKIYRPK